MTAEIVSHTPPGRTDPRCRAQDCDRPASGHSGPWCSAHRRGLALSTALTDALAGFLTLAGESPAFDESVIEAGELIGKGLELLLSHAFDGDEVAVEEEPIKFENADSSYKSRWRVSLGWMV